MIAVATAERLEIQSALNRFAVAEAMEVTKSSVSSKRARSDGHHDGPGGVWEPVGDRELQCSFEWAHAGGKLGDG